MNRQEISGPEKVPRINEQFIKQGSVISWYVTVCTIDPSASKVADGLRHYNYPGHLAQHQNDRHITNYGLYILY